MTKNFKITEHFDFFDMTNSVKYPGLVEENREHMLRNPAYIVNMTKLCILILEPMRKLILSIYDDVLTIESGYRFSVLNKKVGGSELSQHLVAQAADVYWRSIADSWKRVLAMLEVHFAFKYHQWIWYPKKNIIHVSLPVGRGDMENRTDIK